MGTFLEDDPGASVSVSPQGTGGTFAQTQPGGMPTKTVGGFVKNLVPNFATTAQKVGRGLVAAGTEALNDLNPLSDPMNPAQHPLTNMISSSIAHPIKTAGAVGNYYAQRYNLLNGNLGNTLYSDPFGTLLDASGLAYGGAGALGGAARVADAAGAAGVASGLGDAANMARGVGALTNPVTMPTRVLGAASRLPVVGVPLRGLAGVGQSANTMLGNMYLRPQNVFAREIAEGQAPAMQNYLLNNNHEIVPGSVPTGPQALANAPGDLGSLVRIQAAGNWADGILPTVSKTRIDATNAARVAHLPAATETPQSLFAQQELRSANAAQNYPVATSLITSNPELADIMGTDAMRSAIPVARGIASNLGEDFSVGGQQPPSTILGPNGQPIQAPATPIQYPFSTLQHLKLALDKMSANPTGHSISEAQVGSVNTVRGQLIDWMNRNVPRFQNAQSQFAADSVPIGRMQTGVQLHRELVPNNYTGGGQPLSENGFLNATSPENDASTLDAASKIRSDGTNYINNPDSIRFYDRLAQNLTPQDVNQLGNVRNDILRTQRANNLANGVDVGPKITDTNAAGTAGAAAYAVTGHGAVAVARAATDLVRRLGGRMSQAQATRVATMLQTPEGTAQLLQEMQARQARGNAINQGVRNALASPGAINPTVYNALSPNNQQNQP